MICMVSNRHAHQAVGTIDNVQHTPNAPTYAVKLHRHAKANIYTVLIKHHSSHQ